MTAAPRSDLSVGDHADYFVSNLSVVGQDVRRVPDLLSVGGHDDGSGRGVVLRPASAAHHLQDAGRRVLCVTTIAVHGGGFDHHQVGGQVDAHGWGTFNQVNKIQNTLLSHKIMP